MSNKNIIVYRTSSKREMKAVMYMLIGLGYHMCHNKTPDEYELEFPYKDNMNVGIIGKEIHVWPKDSKPKYSNVILDWQVFLDKIIDVPEPIEILLNDDYKAIIHTDIVEVGCQTFTFDKIEELYNVVQTMKGENK